MKKLLGLFIFLLAGNTIAQPVKQNGAGSLTGVALAPASVTTTGNVSVGGSLSVTGVSAFTDAMTLGATVSQSQTRSAAAADGAAYNSLISSVSVSPAAAAEISNMTSQYNWYVGDNANFIANGIEGAVRSRGADESMTARGVYGRFYIDPDYAATLRTGVAGEFSARASYSGGAEIVAEAGTAFVGSRIWMAPYFSDATIANVNNFHGLWIYNEATAKTVTNGIKLGGAGGTAFTNDFNLQNGETIDNSINGMIRQTGDSLVSGQSIIIGSSTFAGGVGLNGPTTAYGTLNVPGGIMGNVGIGTASPGNKLDVNGTSVFRDAITSIGSMTVQGAFGAVGSTLTATTLGVISAPKQPFVQALHYQQGFAAGWTPLYFSAPAAGNDTANMYGGAASSNTFTVPTGAAGFYQINCQVSLNWAASTILGIYVNTSVVSPVAYGYEATTNYSSYELSRTLKLNGGDVVECRLNLNAGGQVPDAGIGQFSMVKVW